VFEFLKTLFNPPPPSSTTAKERLRLVLLSDHLSLSPETLAALKADLLAVISRYVEIDSSHADVTFEHRENDVAVLASIPITGVRERPRAPAQTMSQATGSSATTATAVLPAEPETDAAQAMLPLETAATAPEVRAAVISDVSPESLATAASNASEDSVSRTPAVGAVSAATRRRRRKKAQTAANRPNANAQPLGKPAQA
jgi:cell division topological specificity factor